MNTTQKEIADGEQADQLLQNPAYINATSKVRDGIVKAMADAPMGDEKTHNRLVIALQLLAQIERQIKDVATTGRMARLQVDQGMASRIRSVMKG